MAFIKTRELYRLISADDREMIALTGEAREIQGKIHALDKSLGQLYKKERELTKQRDALQKRQDAITDTLNAYQNLKQLHQEALA